MRAVRKETRPLTGTARDRYLAAEAEQNEYYGIRRASAWLRSQRRRSRQRPHSARTEQAVWHVLAHWRRCAVHGLLCPAWNQQLPFGLRCPRRHDLQRMHPLR